MMSSSEFDPTTHPHRRYNPLTDEYVLVSPHRTKRPWLGQTEAPQTENLPEYDPKCYLCPGNSRTGGDNNGPYDGTLVFPNDFPALLAPPGPPAPQAPHPLLQTQPVEGKCDVLIFHPRHDLTLARLKSSEIVPIIKEWQAIYQRRGTEDGIKYVQIFENKGAMMGCSNPHPHGQVWSVSEVPGIPAKEMALMRQYAFQPQQSPSYAPRGPGDRPCMLCEYAHFEVGVPESEGRVVLKNDHWVALVPWWAIWPFEILLLPYKRHIPSLAELTEEEVQTFASILSSLTIKYDNLFKTSFAYSMGIHQRPVPIKTQQGSEESLEVEENIAHLHLHFTPPLLRSATVRKFLVG
ncbi:galactose-1-phosphate uridyl transferase [Tulasnella sp. 418]|nr:galactose-1-phosphate uridyl transferase [Tulasnella sp. 418]